MSDRDHEQRFGELLALGLDRPELPGGVQLRFHPAEPGEQTAPPAGAEAQLPTAGGGYTLAYRDTTLAPRAFVFVENNTDRGLYVAVLDLSERHDCTVLSPAIFVAPHEAANLNPYGLGISFSFPDGVAAFPGASTLGWLKLVACIQEFDAAAFELGTAGQPLRASFPATATVEVVAARVTTAAGADAPIDDGGVWWSRNVAITLEIPHVPRAADVLEVVALPGGSGDCLAISFPAGSASRRMLVDGGLGSAYEQGLGRYLESLGPHDGFDVVVVTHIDRDHIEGVLRAIHDDRLRTADFWFNGRGAIESLVKARRSTAQGDELSTMIPDRLRNRLFGGRAIHLAADGPTTRSLPSLGAKCTILAPTRVRLERLLEKWPKSVRSATPLDALFEAVEEAEPVVRGVGDFGKDPSRANGSSIAFLFEVDGVSLLLTGDVFADDLEAAIRDLVAARGTDMLHVDLFKLSHHGSRNNLTDSLLQVIAPRAVLVCTDGSGHRHPDADALAKLREHYGDVPIHFTADTDVIRDRARNVGASAPSQLPLRLTFELRSTRNADR